jgi:predicted small lipoprotein YifL
MGKEGVKRALSWMALALVLTALAACAKRPPQWAAPAPTIAPVTLAKAAPEPGKPDLCNAQSLTYLIGRPRTEIPIPVDPSTRQVVCTTCIAPDDQSDKRQRILFDAETGLITAVGCG